MTDKKVKKAEKIEKVEKIAADKKASRVELEERNGVRRPNPDTKTGVVWAVADTISLAQEKPAPRNEVLTEAEKQGINISTAATQYGRWRKFNGLTGTGITTKKD